MHFKEVMRGHKSISTSPRFRSASSVTGTKLVRDLAKC